MASEHWPPFGLRIFTPRLELRVVDDELASDLVDLASAGVHLPGEMPFSIPWTEEPDGKRQRHSMQHYWRLRADMRPDSWTLEFAVLEGGAVVASQGIGARAFAVRRVAGTGSWVGLAHQGRGIGREMRAAVLHLAFDALGALRCESEAFADNPASIAVSRACGYRENGDDIVVRKGERARMVRFALERDDWLPRRRDDIRVTGLEPCLPMLGLAPAAAGG